jgi:hypothetical protein
MPKQFMESDDPQLRQLNDVLVDLITKNLPKVPAWKFIFAEPISIALSILMTPLILVRDIRFFALSASVAYVAYSASFLESKGSAALIGSIIFFATSKKFSSSVFEVIFRLLNLMSFGNLIKIISQGYQTGNVICHLVLSKDSPLFGLLGVYAETMPSISLAEYESLIQGYRDYKMGRKSNFELMISKYWDRGEG